MKEVVPITDDGVLPCLFIEGEMQFKNDRVVIHCEESGLGVSAKSGKDVETGRRSIEQICLVHKKMKALIQ